MKYYKAIAGGYPVMAIMLPPECRIRYEPDEWIKAPGDTMLFVCNSPEEARQVGGARAQIWEVEAKGLRELVCTRYPTVFSDFHHLNHWWRYNARFCDSPLSGSHFAVDSFPDTLMVAKEVKLVRRVA